MKKHFFLALGLTLYCLTVQAQNIRYVKTNGSGNGTSWENASNNIQAMIDELSAKEEGGEIWVAAGTYIPTHKATEDDSDGSATTDKDKAFVLKNNVYLFGGFSGNESSVFERNWKTNVTILSGVLNENTHAYHVVIAAGEVGEAWLDGFTITGGKTAAYADKSSISVNGVSVFRRHGGGMYIEEASPVLTNLIIKENKAHDCGGGIYAMKSASIITDITIEANESELEGGGIFNKDGAILLMNAVVNNNKAVLHGGGIMNSGENVSILSNLKVTNNTSYYGAGISNSGEDLTEGKKCELVITNTLVTNNKSDAEGGGIMNVSADVIFTNMTIAGNATATYGSGMSNNASMIQIRNSIIWNNKDDYSFFPEVYIDNGAEVTYHNCIITKTNLTGNGNLDGTTNNPTFVNEEEKDYRLKNTSPCYNAGSIDFYAAGAKPDLSYITEDVDGNPRIVNDKIDMGAYQNQYSSTVLKTLTIDGETATLKKDSKTDYEITLSFRQTVTIVANPVNPASVVSGDTGSKPVSAGKNMFSIKVKAEDGVLESTYNLEVNIIPKISDDATLKNIKVDDIAAVLKSGSTTIYESAIGFKESVTITTETTNAAATVSGDIGVKTVTPGMNTFSIKVTAEDGITEKTYTLEIMVKDKPSDDASLKGIKVNGIAATLKSGSETNYEITVEFTEKVTITAETTNPNADVTGDVGDKTVAVGINTFSISVSAEDGISQKTYNLEVTVKDEVAIAEIDNGSIKLYPNPVNNSLNIESQQPFEAVSLYNIHGQLVRTFYQQVKNITLEGLPAGIYLIKIKLQGGGELNRKIIKE